MLHHGVKSGEKYPTKVRHFCLALVTYSTRAYQFIRKSFHNHLPALRTIKAWFANSDIRGDPGIQDETIERLKKIAAEYKEKNGHDLICCLIFDEMHLRKQILFSMEKMEYVGFANYGRKPGNEQTSFAKQAIVFLLNGIDVNFEFPVVYHFIDDLDMHQRKNLIEEVIAMVTRCGIRITNLTFDGYSANMPAMELLGAELKINLKQKNRKFRPFIVNPINKNKIFVMLDPCHMEKLIRNRWATCKVFFDGAGNKIEWKYIEDLHKYSCQNDFRTHKITKKHMQWERNAMNVRIAVETFSESVASSIEYLMEHKVPEFIGARPTIDFVRRMDTLFDIFNSRNSNNNNIFKNKMSMENKRVIYDFFRKTIQFFKTLKTEVSFYKMVEKDEGKEDKCDNKAKKSKKERVVVKTEVMPILHTRHKVGFIGFIISMESLMRMFEEYVEENKFITAIPTYCLLQDAVEMMFGRIRACGGSNNNPNVLEFKGAYRRIQCNMRMDLSPGSNCRMFDMFLPHNLFYSNIYFVSSRRARIVLDEKKYEQQKKFIIESIDENNDPDIGEPDDADNNVESVFATQHILDGTSQFMVAYIASQIEKKIINCKQFYCNDCRLVFDQNEKTRSIDAKFLGWVPCATTIEICSHAEKFFKLYNVQQSQPQFDFKVLYCLIFRSMDFTKLFPKSAFQCDVSHKYQFVKCIVGQYIATRAYHVSKQFTLDQQDKMIRQQCNRLVNFKGL